MPGPSQSEDPGIRHLSPFELKDRLIHYARDFTRSQAASHKFLNAGRGNPNWIATTPREAFFLLGQFALEESRRTWDEPNLAGMPRPEGIAGRLQAFLGKASKSPGAELMGRALAYGTGQLGFEADAFVHELVDGIVGDNYPEPDRMLVHIEQIAHRYLMAEMCDDRPPEGRFDLFATEGGTAAMCYVFDSLVANHVLKKGDTIALGTPIFTPYLEIPHLAEYQFRTVEIAQREMINGRHLWQYPDEEIAKLEDPKVKAFFLVHRPTGG
jgi:aspartate 4-decarboxylase